MKRLTAFALAAAALVPPLAHAAPPANLARTTWNVQINQTLEQLVFTTQGGPGAPGATNCRALNGTIGIAPVHGWYCPVSGRIVLRHHNIGSGAVVRVFSGHVSDDTPGQPRYMGGTVLIFNSQFGELGERNFSAQD